MRSQESRVIASAFIAGSVVVAMSEVMADGNLDPTFGTDGRVITDISSGYDEARAVALAPDGRIIVAGVSGSAAARDFALARYTASGALDPGFGHAGTVRTDIGGGGDEAWAVAVQPDARIIAAGTADGDFGIVRYNPNGSLDPRFGTGGKTTTNFGGDDRANAVALQADGKIVAVGFVDRRDFAIARYHSDGTPDEGFGFGGAVTTDIAGTPDAAFAVAIQPDGMIIAAGSAGAFPVARFALVRYLPDGSLDESFGSNGKVTVDLGRDARAHGIAVQSDGKIVTEGFVDRGSSRDAVLTRHDPNGAIDVTFGLSGRIATDFGGRNFGNAVAIQSDGRIVVAGADDLPPYYDFVIARYERDGRIDATFGADGRLLTEFGGNSWINAVAVQPDGRIVAVGYVRSTSGADFAVVRYQVGQDGSTP